MVTYLSNDKTFKEMKKKLIPLCMLLALIALCGIVSWLLPKVALAIVMFLLCVNIALTMERNYSGNGKS